MEKRKKLLFYLTFTLALLAIVATAVSLATDNWVESTPKKKDNSNVTAPRSSSANFGLFKGTLILDYGLSARKSVLKVVCKPSKDVCMLCSFLSDSSQDNSEALNCIEKVLKENTTDNNDSHTDGLFNYGNWVTCIISASLSIVFGLVTMGFAIFNIFGKPIERITGPIGLYLWNGIAFLFAFLEMILFVILFQTTLKKNFLEKDAYEKFAIWHYTNLGYSFFLVFCAVVLYLINIVILLCSGYKIGCSFRKETDKDMDTGTIVILEEIEMISAILSRLVILVFGTLYPAYASYKAVKTKNVHEYVKWMMYWIVFALFCAVETFADVFLSWCPFYYEIKIIFVLWLLSPVTQGSSFIYRKFVHPQLTKREKEIDEAINQAKTKGYSTLMMLGHRGLTYATNIVIKTAIKGQSTLVEHVMKSYSTNDLRVKDSREIDVVDAGAFIGHNDDEFEKRLRDDNYELQGREKQDPIRLQRVLLQRSMGDGADHKHKRIQPTPELSNVEEAEHENSSISQIDPEGAAVTETYEEVIYSPRKSGRYTPREIKSDPYATLPRTRSRQRPRLHDQ